MLFIVIVNQTNALSVRVLNQKKNVNLLIAKHDVHTIVLTHLP